MRKDIYPEENKEVKIPEYFSFEGESFHHKQEAYKRKNEENSKSEETYKGGIEENTSGHRTLEKPTDVDLSKVQKSASTASKITQGIIVTTSSVAVIVGGVIIYNESILPPAHVEILEAAPDGNNIYFLVWASNYDSEADWAVIEKEMEESCDLIVELYGDEQTYTLDMKNLGYFEGLFTDLKYDTEYELSVYQEITIGITRPLLASQKIRTSIEGKEEYNEPIFNELTFAKKFSEELGEYLEYNLNYEDLDGYWSEFELVFFDIESGLELDRESIEPVTGSLVLEEAIFYSEVDIQLVCKSTYPYDLGEEETEISRVIYSSRVDLGAMEVEFEPSEFYGVFFQKSEGEYEAVYFTLSFNDPISRWGDFVLSISPADDEDGNVYETYVEYPYYEQKECDIPLEFYNSVINYQVKAIDYLDDSSSDAGRERIVLYEGTIDLFNVDTFRVEYTPTVTNLLFERRQYVNGEEEVFFTLYYDDRYNVWSDFEISIYCKGTKETYKTKVQYPYTDAQKLNIGPETPKTIGDVTIEIDCLHTDDPGSPSDTYNEICYYEATYNFSDLDAIQYEKPTVFNGLSISKSYIDESNCIVVAMDYSDVNGYWSDFTLGIYDGDTLIDERALDSTTNPQYFSFESEATLRVVITVTSTDPNDLIGSSGDPVNKVVYEQEVDFSNL